MTVRISVGFLLNPYFSVSGIASFGTPLDVIYLFGIWKCLAQPPGSVLLLLLLLLLLKSVMSQDLALH
jgi:hypothetical protein